MNKQDYADRREKIKEMLLENKTYDYIIDTLKTSRSTIANVSAQLKKDGLKLPVVSVQFTGSATGELLKKKKTGKKGEKDEFELLITDINTGDMTEEAKRRYNIEPSAKNYSFLLQLWERKQKVIDETGFDEEIDISELIKDAASKLQTQEEIPEHDSEIV